MWKRGGERERESALRHLRGLKSLAIATAGARSLAIAQSLGRSVASSLSTFLIQSAVSGSRAKSHALHTICIPNPWRFPRAAFSCMPRPHKYPSRPLVRDVCRQAVVFYATSSLRFFPYLLPSPIQFVIPCRISCAICSPLLGPFPSLSFFSS